MADLVRHALNFQPIPGLAAAWSSAQVVYNTLDQIRVHKEQCTHFYNESLKMLNFLREREGVCGNDSVNDAATELDHLMRRAHDKMKKWSELNRVKAFIKQDEIQRDLKELHTSLEYASRRFSMTSQVEIIRAQELFEQSRARDMTQLTEMLQAIVTTPQEINAITGMQRNDVQTVMRSLQEELIHEDQRPPDPLREAAFQQGLKKLKKDTGILPPLTDLTGEVKKLGDCPIDIGGSADIWDGEWLGERVALKVLRSVGRMDSATERRFRREIDIWRRLDHPNVLPLYGICIFGGLTHLVSPYATNNHVLRYLKLNPDANRLKLLSDAANGLAYLHSSQPPIIHGDFRAANLLVSQTGDAFISDFGLARLEQVAEAETITSMNAVGACRWMAPELVMPTEGRRATLTTQTDVWSFGMCSFEMFTGERPYNHCDFDIHVVKAISEGFRHPRQRGTAETRGLSDGVWSLMMSCWEQKPFQRPDMSFIAGTLSRLEVVHSARRRRESTSTRSISIQQTGPHRRDNTVAASISEEPEDDIDWMKAVANMNITNPDVVSIVSPIAIPPPPREPPPTLYQMRQAGSSGSQTHSPLSSSPGRSSSAFTPSSFGSTTSSVTRSSLTQRGNSTMMAPPANGSAYSMHTDTSRRSLATPSRRRPNTGSSTYSYHTTEYHSSPPLLDTTPLPESGALEVVMSKELTVESGTLEGLINLLVIHSANRREAHNFRDVFLTTYPAFTMAEVVLDVLLNQYHFACTDDLPPPQKVDIKLNVLGVVRQWLEVHRLETKDWNLLLRIQDFVSDIREPPKIAEIAERLNVELVNPALRKLQDAQPSSATFSIRSRASDPSKMAKLSELTPADLAECLTHIDSNLFLEISAADCIFYLKSIPGDACAVVTDFIHKDEQVAAWIQKLIMKVANANDRAQKIAYFVSTANECKALGNFSSMRAIVLALQSSIIGRLRRTREELPQWAAQQLKALAEIMDSNNNYDHYRVSLRSHHGPVIPILYVHLRGIKHSYSKLPGKVQGRYGPLINFSRYARLCHNVKEALSYQHPSHRLHPDDRKLNLVQRQLRSIIINEELEKRLEQESQQHQHEEEREYKSFSRPLADLGMY